MKPKNTIIENRPCATCGKPVTGKYCTACGEKVLSELDHSIKHFLEEWFELIFHFDSKFLRTVRFLVFKPGFLTKEYWSGRRIAYMKPFQLLIVLNVIYFLSAALAAHWGLHVSVMVPDLEVILNARIYSHWLSGFIHAAVPGGPQALALYEHQFNDHLEHLSKSLVILLVPLLTLFLQLLYIHKKKPFLYHFVASTHLICFYIVQGSIILPSYRAAQVLRWSPTTTATILSYIPLALLVVYLFLVFRRIYHGSMIWTITATLLLVFFGIDIITQVYDFILFWIAYLMV